MEWSNGILGGGRHGAHVNFRRTLNFPLRLLTRDDMLHYVFHAAKIGKKWICGVRYIQKILDNLGIYYSKYFKCLLHWLGWLLKKCLVRWYIKRITVLPIHRTRFPFTIFFGDISSFQYFDIRNRETNWINTFEYFFYKMRGCSIFSFVK